MVLGEFYVARNNYDTNVIASRTAEYIYNISKDRLHKKDVASCFYIGIVNEKRHQLLCQR